MHSSLDEILWNNMNFCFQRTDESNYSILKDEHIKTKEESIERF